MAVFKSAVEVREPGGRSIGVCITYIHLPRGLGVAQDATGTVSLRRWDPADQIPTHLSLDDGRCLPISVSSEKLSDCSRNHILRFSAVWPPTESRGTEGKADVHQP